MSSDFFKCPRCHRLSRNRGDIRNKYCAECHKFWDDEAEIEERIWQEIQEKESMVTGNEILEMNKEVHKMLHDAVKDHGCDPGEAYKFVEGKKLKNGRTVKFSLIGGTLRAKFLLDGVSHEDNRG